MIVTLNEALLAAARREERLTVSSDSGGRR